MQHEDQVAKRNAAVATPSRRSFLKGSGLLAGGVVTSGTLATLAAHTAWAQGGHHDKDKDDRARGGRRSHYGELHPALDQDGNYVLALPRGFRYCTFSRTGEAFGNGLAVARNHDGMACFDGPGKLIRLIRNHELRNAAGVFTLGVPVPDALKYDAKGMGGCMTLDFDPKSKKLVRQFASIGGTFVNCAGGWSWRKTGWLTCEETTNGVNQGFARPHGYNFFVPAWANSAVAALPLKWMGRFAHEASVADDRGVVYQTEDSGNNSGLYRSIPNHRGDLTKGGTLEMLAVKGSPGATLITGQTVGAKLPVEWVNIDNPDPNLEGGAMSCFNQGRAKGGAAFNRLEGIFMSHDGRSAYFVSTSGGQKGYGQLWHYIPGDDKLNDDDQLVLVFESPAGSILDSPDNMCVTPNGGILFCEDDANALGVDDHDTHPLAPGIENVNRLIGLGVAGEPFEFAVNILNDSEFAGGCFSPDGEILFVNLFGNDTPGSGMTCAIWGPWEKGPL
jgi:secreted PhoX family phosphatase